MTCGRESHSLESLVAGVLFGGWLTLRIRIHHGRRILIWIGCSQTVLVTVSNRSGLIRLRNNEDFPVKGQKTQRFAAHRGFFADSTAPSQAGKIAKRHNSDNVHSIMVQIMVYAHHPSSSKSIDIQQLFGTPIPRLATDIKGNIFIFDHMLNLSSHSQSE